MPDKLRVPKKLAESRILVRFSVKKGNLSFGIRTIILATSEGIEYEDLKL
jgi:hypothetical protein